MLKRWLLVLPGILILALAMNTAWNLVQSELWRSQTEDFLNHWATEAEDDAGFTVDEESGYSLWPVPIMPWIICPALPCCR